MANITLDDLVSEATTSAIRVLQRHELIRKDGPFNPKIWVGIWIDPTGHGPGGGPLTGGPIGGGGIQT